MTSLHALHPMRGRVTGRGSSRSAQLHRAALLARCSLKQNVADPVTSASSSADDTKPAAYGRPRATFKGSKLGRQPIQEAQRPLAEYMSLPASQYSVLDARRIERVDDTTFKCYVGELRFFSWSVEPVITVSVTVEEGGCTIRLLGCRLQGSPFVEDINDKFTATMTNVVRHRALEEAGTVEGGEEPEVRQQAAVAASAGTISSAGVLSSEEEPEQGGRGASSARTSASSSCHDDGGDGLGGSSQGEGEAAAGRPAMREIVSDTSIQVCVEVPAWCGFLPVPSLESAGSRVMQGVLNVAVPRFLAQLRTDYERWAAGDESRRPVGEVM